MNHTIILTITSVLTFVIVSLLTLYILDKKGDRKRNKKKASIKQGDIITPLQIKKYQNKFPILPNEIFKQKSQIIVDTKVKNFEIVSDYVYYNTIEK